MTRNPPHPQPPLLVGYGNLADAGSDVLGVVNFGANIPLTATGVPQPLVQLRPLAVNTAEIWRVSKEVTAGRQGRIHWAATEDVLFAAVDPHPEGGSLEEAAYATYSEMLGFVRDSGYRHFLRVWNHVPQINLEPEGLERYRRFSIGRHRAFEEFSYRLDGDLPAASAVGSHRGELTVYFLAAKAPGQQFENPRQISAFAYPPEYGPKSPSFSRGCVRRDGADAAIFLSGTASIVGHRSVHEGNLLRQLQETMLNIETLLGHAGQAHSLGQVTLHDLTSLKIYVRDPRDRDEIHTHLAPLLSAACSLLYVEADICRRELLLEIEGVANVRRN